MLGSPNQQDLQCLTQRSVINALHVHVCQCEHAFSAAIWAQEHKGNDLESQSFEFIIMDPGARSRSPRPSTAAGAAGGPRPPATMPRDCIRGFEATRLELVSMGRQLDSTESRLEVAAARVLELEERLATVEGVLSRMAAAIAPSQERGH